jgi:hypothetical protein
MWDRLTAWAMGLGISGEQKEDAVREIERNE